MKSASKKRSSNLGRRGFFSAKGDAWSDVRAGGSQPAELPTRGGMSSSAVQGAGSEWYNPVSTTSDLPAPSYDWMKVRPVSQEVVPGSRKSNRYKTSVRKNVAVRLQH